MEVMQEFFANCYRDSVSLMQLSSKIAAQEGIIAASAQMATKANIDLMVDTGVLSQQLEPKPNDLLIVVKAESSTQAEQALTFAKEALNETKTASANEEHNEPLRSIAMAKQAGIEGQLALISTPGEFAAAEAMKALRQGLNVMIFSDNVSPKEEIKLKQYAKAHDLIVMGPDCGTAIIQGIPLAFANVVANGDIGIVGASGTGIQQVSCLIDQMGLGISHAIGTGGHDLSEDVGGISMLSGLSLLAEDAHTKVIVLISKPPAKSVEKEILAQAKQCAKPVIINFLGSDNTGKDDNIIFAKTLEQAAILAAEACQGSAQPLKNTGNNKLDINGLNLGHKQQYLRALYTGGTFCYEAQILLHDSLRDCYSNTPTQSVKPLDNIWQSQNHTIIDLGDDDFTRGKPHPMIDPSTRNERILQEAGDEETLVILVDLVLGYGAHENPASALADVIKQAKSLALKDGRTLIFVGFICGTDKDPQNYNAQKQQLEEAGLLLAPSNAQAAALALSFIEQKKQG